MNQSVVGLNGRSSFNKLKKICNGASISREVLVNTLLCDGLIFDEEDVIRSG